MSTRPTYVKDPDATLDYSEDWALWLPAGDAIIDHEVLVPDGLTGGESILTGTIQTVWLSGGTLGTTYPVTFRVTTQEGRGANLTIHIIVANR